MFKEKPVRVSFPLDYIKRMLFYSNVYLTEYEMLAEELPFDFFNDIKPIKYNNEPLISVEITGIFTIKKLSPTILSEVYEFQQNSLKIHMIFS
jgi:hypothetical protein